MPRKKRKKHTTQEKTAILRDHLINKVPASDFCDKHGAIPRDFWLEELEREAIINFHLEYQGEG
jgi:hypothetical protein